MCELTEFYEDSEIFLTGGSGVVGKALIEKLLRSTNVRCIYVLLRTRRQLGAEQRLAKLRNAKIFGVLREKSPEMLDKLIAIKGDVTQPMLGISPADVQRMAKVSLVFHCAATVRFDEPLKVALRLNVGGTLEALKFAETLRQLRVFVHVSTFYSNPYLKYVEPKHYPSPMDWRKCLQMLNDIKDEQMFEALTQKMIVGFPNTYTFTKNIAESLINDHRAHLPVIIYRPSIVLFAVREPLPGYAPSLMGAMGLFSLVGVGILKTVYLGRNIRLDLTPQDIGIKGLMYFAYRGSKIYQQGTPAEMPVFMSSSCTHLPHTFKHIAEQMDDKGLWYDAAFEKNLLLPGCTYTDSRLHYEFLVFTKQILPALLVDFLLTIFGRKPVVMGIVRKAYGTLEVMKPFLFNTYDSPGTSEFSLMSEETQGTEFDVTEAFDATRQNELMVNACRDMVYSIRRDLLNEQPSTVRRSQRILQVKTIIYNAVRLFLLYKLLGWLWRSFF